MTSSGTGESRHSWPAVADRSFQVGPRHNQSSVKGWYFSVPFCPRRTSIFTSTAYVSTYNRSSTPPFDSKRTLSITVTVAVNLIECSIINDATSRVTFQPSGWAVSTQKALKTALSGG